MKRGRISRRKSIRNFRNHTGQRTRNIVTRSMRGGYRI